MTSVQYSLYALCVRYALTCQHRDRVTNPSDVPSHSTDEKVRIKWYLRRGTYGKVLTGRYLWGGTYGEVLIGRYLWGGTLGVVFVTAVHQVEVPPYVRILVVWILDCNLNIGKSCVSSVRVVSISKSSVHR